VKIPRALWNSASGGISHDSLLSTEQCARLRGDKLPTSKVSCRILLIAPQPFYEDRGTPIAVKWVLEALSERGDQVDLLTYPLGENIELPGLRIFRLQTPFKIRHIPIGFSAQKLVLDAFLVSAIGRRLRQERYKCIHAVEEAAFLGVMAGRRHGVPVIYDMQSSLPEHLMKHRLFRGAVIQQRLRSLERWLIQNADFVICSAGLEEYVRTVDPYAKVKEWHFPSASIDVSSDEIQRLREELGLAPEMQVVLYTGNFEPYQGVSRLLDAASKVLSQLTNTVFVLVGATKPADFSLSSKAAELVQRGALRLLPRQPRSMIPPFLAMADVVVSPREPGGNLPLKIFDYMAAGKAIVATDSPTHRTVLNDERAVLVDSSAEALGGAIVRLLQDRQSAERLGAAAQVYAREKLEWKAFVEMIAQVYDSVTVEAEN
jgi:glycosyltransferase involved in cell wall biosynthesis